MKRRDLGFRSKEFTPARKRRGKRAGVRYNLDAIPEDLWKAFRLRCRAFVHPDGRTGISLRARLLTLMKADSEARREEDVAAPRS